MAQTGKVGCQKKLAHPYSGTPNARQALRTTRLNWIATVMTRERTKKFGLVARCSQSFYRCTRTSFRILAALSPLEIARLANPNRAAARAPQAVALLLLQCCQGESAPYVRRSPARRAVSRSAQRFFCRGGIFSRCVPPL